MIDTLAAACAELGDFDHAVAIEREAMTTGNLSPEIVAGMQHRLDIYLKREPYREKKMFAAAKP